MYNRRFPRLMTRAEMAQEEKQREEEEYIRKHSKFRSKTLYLVSNNVSLGEKEPSCSKVRDIGKKRSNS